MTLLSYISCPVVDTNGNIDYIKIDLQTNKVLVNKVELIDINETMQDTFGDGDEEFSGEEECCEEGCCMGECKDGCCGYDNTFVPTKEGMIYMLNQELEKAKESGDSELEKEIIEALQMINM